VVTVAETAAAQIIAAAQTAGITRIRAAVDSARNPTLGYDKERSRDSEDPLIALEHRPDRQERPEDATSSHC
jgi:hypothetical protein